MNRWDRRQQRAWQDVAQICLNGHVTNSSTKDRPQFSTAFCADCGAPTITECPSCNQEIPGKYHNPGVTSFSEFPAPAFCTGCGAPYPWTQAAIEAAQELARDLDALTEEERKVLVRSIDDLVRDSPRSPVAVNRYRKLLEKAGSTAAGAMKEILVKVATEAVKSQLWP